ncbi:unnamed protein product [Nezara viridula]|uniref:Uncharacterized protein n=1 Tax=Nezara viridula TaxID=85310 RepID=A0A9P0HP13_NEZVI|nr:unnamed protein product [Nezara viridula]
MINSMLSIPIIITLYGLFWNSFVGGGSRGVWNPTEVKEESLDNLEKTFLARIPIGYYKKCATVTTIEELKLLDLLEDNKNENNSDHKCFLKCLLDETGVLNRKNVDCKAFNEILNHKKMTLDEKLKSEYLCEHCKEKYFKNKKINNYEISKMSQNGTSDCELAYEFIKCGNHFNEQKRTRRRSGSRNKTFQLKARHCSFDFASIIYPNILKLRC